jgi:hypothetical protein
VSLLIFLLMLAAFAVSVLAFIAAGAFDGIRDFLERL